MATAKKTASKKTAKPAAAKKAVAAKGSASSPKIPTKAAKSAKALPEGPSAALWLS